nr:MAG TPA: hypothetical protein [Caudoviricetes sp.]
MNIKKVCSRLKFTAVKRLYLSKLLNVNNVNIVMKSLEKQGVLNKVYGNCTLRARNKNKMLTPARVRIKILYTYIGEYKKYFHARRVNHASR